MKFIFLCAITSFIFMLTFQSVEAQAIKKVPAKETSLIAHLVKEANQPDSHSAGDVYLLVTIGKIDYTAELKSGKIISQKNAQNPSGGFYGDYAEVSLILMDKSKQETSQGSGQILKFNGGKWKRVALSESDYQCVDVKSIPKTVLKALKVECN